MFESLKKKFLSFMGKDDKKETKKETSEKKKSVKNEKTSPTPKKGKDASSSKKSSKDDDYLDLKEISVREKSKEEIEEDQKREKEEKLKEKEVPQQEEKKEEKVVQEDNGEETLHVGEIEDVHQEKKEAGFFARLIGKISSKKITQEEFDELFQEIEVSLLEHNVAMEAVDKIRDSLSKDFIGQQLNKDHGKKKIVHALKDSILNILQDSPDLVKQIKSKEGVFTIIFFGINGTGKTTTIAKVANFLAKHKISVALAAADTFRAASIEQLKAHADKLKVPCIAQQYGSDPAAVAFDALAYAKSNKIKVVLIDTAGRMYTKDNLMKEMEKIIRISKPDLKFFVGESITGNDAIDQVKTFNEAIGIDGIILTKSDIDDKSGTILSVTHVTSKPIYFLGTGQEYDDLVPFKKKDIIKHLGLD